MMIGGFTGGLLDGLRAGAELGSNIRRAIDANRDEKLRNQAMDEAKKSHQAAISNSIKDTGDPGTFDQPPPEFQGGMTADGKPTTKRFMVGDQGFDTLDQAKIVAEQKAPTLMEHLENTFVPQMQEEYIRRGELDKAKAWDSWAKDNEGKRKMGSWAKAYTAAQLGDTEGAARGLFELYKKHDDGIEPLSHSPVKDKDGNLSGFNVSWRTKDGKEESQFFDRDSIVELGVTTLKPENMFERAYKNKQEKATKAHELMKQRQAAMYAITQISHQGEVDKSVATHKGGIQENENKNNFGRKLQAMQIERQYNDVAPANQMTSKVQAGVDIANRHGVNPTEVVESMLGVKKPTDRLSSDEQVRRGVYEKLVGADPRFSRLPVAEQEDRINKALGVIKKGGAKTNAPPAKKTLVRDNKTGQLIYR